MSAPYDNAFADAERAYLEPPLSWELCPHGLPPDECDAWACMSPAEALVEDRMRERGL